MTPIHWIQLETPGALGIMAAPSGGDSLPGQVRAWKTCGVSQIVSALEPMEEAYLDLSDEASLCERHGIRFERFRVTDRSTPSLEEEKFRFVQRIAGLLTEGGLVVVHCRMGIGRSGMLCAATLVALGYASDDALMRVEAARGLRVPDTWAQVEWVKSFERWLNATS